jgi:hypothetical protein
MATPGTFISAVGHSGLIVWLILGWGFDAEPLQIETMDVSVISGEEFEQMRARTTPDPGAADPEAPVPPEVDETPPPAPAEEEPTATAPPPEPVEQPVEETPPPPPPEPLVTEADDQPPPEPTAPADPPPTPDIAVSEEATPPQAPTVASQITAPPPPDANVDDIVRQEVVPDDSVEPEVVEQEQDAAAPEETTTAIVIEDLAPRTSVRPSARPSRPAPQPGPEPEETEIAEAEPAPSEPEVTDANVLDDLLAEVTAEQPAALSGPPLTGLEESSFRLAVSACWVVDNGSQAANVTVEVAFGLNRDGTVTNNEVRLLSASGGDDRARRTAYEWARRAVVRCSIEGGGYDLPPEKYDSWKEVIITFDPSTMRLR